MFLLRGQGAQGILRQELADLIQVLFIFLLDFIGNVVVYVKYLLQFLLAFSVQIYQGGEIQVQGLGVVKMGPVFLKGLGEDRIELFIGGLFIVI